MRNTLGYFVDEVKKVTSTTSKRRSVDMVGSRFLRNTLALEGCHHIGNFAAKLQTISL
jgi:hypothetical protein